MLYFHTYMEKFLHESLAYIRFYDTFFVYLKREGTEITFVVNIKTELQDILVWCSVRSLSS